MEEFVEPMEEDSRWKREFCEREREYCGPFREDGEREEAPSLRMPPFPRSIAETGRPAQGAIRRLLPRMGNNGTHGR